MWKWPSIDELMWWSEWVMIAEEDFYLALTLTSTLLTPYWEAASPSPVTLDKDPAALHHCSIVSLWMQRFSQTHFGISFPAGDSKAEGLNYSPLVPQWRLNLNQPGASDVDTTQLVSGWHNTLISKDYPVKTVLSLSVTRITWILWKSALGCQACCPLVVAAAVLAFDVGSTIDGKAVSCSS